MPSIWGSHPPGVAHTAADTGAGLSVEHWEQPALELTLPVGNTRWSPYLAAGKWYYSPATALRASELRAYKRELEDIYTNDIN